MRRFLAAAGACALAGGLALGAASCNVDEKGRGDAPVGDRHESPRQVWLAPDKYPNITAWCIGKNGVYVTTREAPPAVVPEDPNCQEGGILREE